MACFHPLTGYRSRTVNPASGKRSVVFNIRDGFHDQEVTVPCGQCVGCRLERSRQWAIRCVHEASCHSENCFITLTYSDEFLPPWLSLVKSDFQKFMKRLRKKFPGRVIRYFHAGEYGDLTGRPHYHACLFGFDFPDKYPWATRKGFQAWRSKILEELWPFGNSEIGSVTFESAAYVARYIMKKVTGKLLESHYQMCDVETGEVSSREPEYCTMSRRPGIAAGWYSRFGQEVFRSDSVVIRGRRVRPPRFYFGKFELADPVGARIVCLNREMLRKEFPDWRRLRAMELFAKGKLTFFGKRGLE